jgi:exodeoxyribonuclease VII small subunit
MSSNNKQDFGAKLKELEAITEWFESDEVDLNAALAKFERGMQLADELKKELGEIENRVDVIKRKFDAPSADTAPVNEPPVLDPASVDPAPADAGDPTLF